MKRAVIIPTLNEEAAIEATIRQINAVDEIVVVDGASDDQTVDRASKLGATVIVEGPTTYTRVVLAGLAHCRDYDQVIVMDAESHHFADIQPYLNQPVAILAGKRQGQKKSPLRHFISCLGQHGVHWRFPGLAIRDTSNGFRAYRRNFVRYLLDLPELDQAPSYAFNAAIAIHTEGWPVAEFPMSYTAGQTYLNRTELRLALGYLMTLQRQRPIIEPTTEELLAFVQTMYGPTFLRFCEERRYGKHHYPHS